MGPSDLGIALHHDLLGWMMLCRLDEEVGQSDKPLEARIPEVTLVWHLLRIGVLWRLYLFRMR